MKRDPSAPQLSAVFVDYDNIYLSLKRKNEEAARRFSKDAAVWLKAIESGRLITSHGVGLSSAPRRIVLNRCYGNPVPRRNQADNTTDMNSFPFVRHSFLRAGFEIVDCPPLTSQQKNAADIRMVMDLRDNLTHDTYFDEFVILSGDADFTPVLHRLRQHARRTVIFSNDHTSTAYSAICDGEVREADLIAALLDPQGQIEQSPQLADAGPAATASPHAVALQAARAPAQPTQLRLEDLRQMIMAEVVAGIRAASGPVPLEALADRAIRALGHERTVGTAWAGAGSFRELMRIALPTDLRLSENPPFYAYDPQRHVTDRQVAERQLADRHFAERQQPAADAPVASAPTQPRRAMMEAAPAPVAAKTAPTIMQQREALAAALSELTQPEAVDLQPAASVQPAQLPDELPPRYAPLRPSAGPTQRAPTPAPQSGATVQPAAISARAAQQEPLLHRSQATRSPAIAQPVVQRPDPAAVQQATMVRIQEACQAPQLSARDYRVVFDSLAQEISENGLTGAQTLSAVGERCQQHGIAVRREDIRFVLDVVSEPDPWFEQGATPTLFAGRFRNFAVARCRDHGLQLSATELDLIDAWIMGTPMQPPTRTFAAETVRAPTPQPAAAPREPASQAARWWSLDEGRQHVAEQHQPPADGDADDDFPRIIRARQRG